LAAKGGVYVLLLTKNHRCASLGSSPATLLLPLGGKQAMAAGVQVSLVAGNAQAPLRTMSPVRVKYKAYVSIVYPLPQLCFEVDLAGKGYIIPSAVNYLFRFSMVAFDVLLTICLSFVDVQ
jgi:hypothetical protein